MKEFWRFFESNNTIGLLLVDPELKVLFTNDHMAHLYPVVTGEPFTMKTRFRQVLDLSLKEDKAIAGFPIHETVNGKPRHIMLYTHPYREKGVTSALAAIVCDISSLYQSFIKQIHEEKLQLLGDMAAGTANVILNPLTVIKGIIQLIETNLKTDVTSIDLPTHPLNRKLNEYFSLIYDHVQQVNDTLQSLLLVGKTCEMKLKPLNIVPFLLRTIAEFQNDALHHDITLACKFPSADAQVLGCEHYLKEALKALVRNAFDATKKGGTVKFQTLVSDKRVEFVVIDYGGGIPEEIMQQIKKPFFSTKENALGIGLNLCERIVSKMGGTLVISSADNITEARIQLPKIG